MKKENDTKTKKNMVKTEKAQRFVKTVIWLALLIVGILKYL